MKGRPARYAGRVFTARFAWTLVAGLLVAVPQMRAQAPGSPLAPPAITLTDAAWTCEEVGAGVEWCDRRFADLFGSPQSLAVLRVDLARPGVRIRIAEASQLPETPPRLRLERTSDLAARSRAVAAVNGNFFDGFAHQGPVVIDGQVRSFTPAGHAQAKATFGIDKDEQPRFWPKRPDGWLIPPSVAHAISAGPMLVEGGAAVTYAPDDVFAVRRHPRTAVCAAPNRTLYLVVADGRAKEADGLSLPELAAVMRALGCTDAMNLDGGGSSTMWVRGEAPTGVVNHPSDDRRFDVFGERAVAAAILVLAPDVIVGDIREATLAGGPEARWELPVYFGGTYRVFLRHRGASRQRLTIDVNKTRAQVDLAGRSPGWAEVGTIDVPNREGALIPGPVWVPIVVQSASGDALAVDAVRLEQASRN